MKNTTDKARLLLGASVALLCSVAMAAAEDLQKVTFMTSWYAQAEHGGFYQAKATGLYEKAGLDVTIKKIPQASRHLAIGSGDIQ